MEGSYLRIPHAAPWIKVSILGLAIQGLLQVGLGFGVLGILMNERTARLAA